MSNFSEIIHVESLRKQLLNQIEVLDNQILNLNQSVKQKGLEVNLSQIENAADIFKYQNELKSSEIELALLQKWLELLNAGVDPKSIDLAQLKLDVIESAKSAQDSFEDQFLDLKEMVNVNESMMALSNRLGKQFFSPNLHPDIYKDKESIDAQLRLNTTMSEPELAGSVFTYIFPKTLKQLLKSTELDEDQNVVVNSLLQKYNSFIEKSNLSDVELEEILNTIKSDEELKLIFKQSPDLKPLLNTTLKEIILDIELPEGKPVTELKEIIIRKKSEIAFLQKQLETVDEIGTKEGQDKILDINDQYFKQIQELKAQIESLNLQIGDKIQSMNLQDQQSANDALENTKSSLESAFVNSSESVEPDKGAIVIQKARTEIINNNFEVEQKEYKEKLLELHNLLLIKVKNLGKIGNLIFEFNDDFGDYESLNEEVCINGPRNLINFKNQNIEVSIVNDSDFFGIYSCGKLDNGNGFHSGLFINKLFISKDCKLGNVSLKNGYIDIKSILKRDFEIDIDNLESKSDLIETSPTNLIENQETQAREKYKQIQDICNRLIEKVKKKELPNFSKFKNDNVPGNRFKCGNLEIYITLDEKQSKHFFINLESPTFEFQIHPFLAFENSRIRLYDRRLYPPLVFMIGGTNNENNQIPTNDQLSLYYKELINTLNENNIEL
jgi:hypothetical protein